MMRPLFDIATLKNDIEAGALILTSNNRLASKIRQAWGRYQQQDHKTCWHQPEIYAIEHWIHEQWLCCCDSGAQHAETGAIASPAQEQLLWETSIEEDTEKPDMLLPTNFSTLARNSYNIIQRWQIPMAELQQDSPLLYRWVQNFRHKLKQHCLITSADSATVVLNGFQDRFKNKDKSQQPAIVTVGFDTIPPLYQSILISTGRNVIKHRADPGKSDQRREVTAERACFYDEQQELMAAAAWAAHRHRQNPEHRIGIIIPELSRIRGQVERIFRQQLEPDYHLPDQLRSAPPFNISVGVPLSKTPMVASALSLLSLNRQKLPLEQLCQLLNSPFWGDNKCGENKTNTDIQVRAFTEKRLRNLARHQLSCNEFRHQLFQAEQSIGQPEPGEADGFTLSQALQQMESLRRESPGKTSIQQWCSLFQRQLDALNWPGPRSLDSVEYQQYQHWLQVLEQYLALDQLQREFSQSEALRQLRQLADHCIFQAETEDAPIQILGLLESSSLRFDELWITGMDNHSWPPAIAPNPLLPIGLQQKYQTPRSHPARELQLAQDQISHFKQAADHVIFSVSEFDASRQKMVSTLITDLPIISPDSLPPQHQPQTSPQAELEKIDCEYAPPVQLAPSTSSQTDIRPAENLRGGSSIFRDQASCPFNAFARHRLGALKPPEPLLGLSAMDRGSLLHDCLEQLWQQLTCQQQLLALSDQALTQLIDNTATTVLRRWQKKRPDLFGPVFTHIEKQRLIQLLDQWLALEKTRPAFQVVAFEQATETNFGGLPLKLIIDRIDETDTGRKVIIDYKTGKANISSWLGDRPEQPQLPLYVLCSDTPVAAATFAVINVSQQQFVGFSETADLLPDVHPPGKKNEPQSWGELLDQWQHNLTNLAEEFRQGYAAVQIFKPVALQYQQELEPLNRLAELSSTSGTDGLSDNGETGK